MINQLHFHVYFSEEIRLTLTGAAQFHIATVCDPIGSCVSEGSGCSLRLKCLIHVRMHATMVVYKQTKKSWRCYLLPASPTLRCLSPIRPRMAEYLGHRAADKGRLDP